MSSRGRMWDCTPDVRTWEIMGVDMDFMNATCELVDNGVRACYLRTDVGPREVHVFLFKTGADWFMQFRDTGIGMNDATLPFLAKMAAPDDTARPVVDSDPCHANGMLHKYAVGGKRAGVQLCAANGKVAVESRQPAETPGAKDVCQLTLSVAECLRWQEEAAADARLRALLPPSERTAAAAARSPWELNGGVAAPSAVHLGKQPAADGGLWHGSGTAVLLGPLEPELLARLVQNDQINPLGMAKFQQHIKSVFYHYIMPQEAPPPPFPVSFSGAADARAPGAKLARKAGAADKGKAPMSLPLPPPVAEPAAPPMDIIVQGVNLRECITGLMSNLMPKLIRDPDDIFCLDMEVMFANDPSIRSLVRLELSYAPFMNGAWAGAWHAFQVALTATLSQASNRSRAC